MNIQKLIINILFLFLLNGCSYNITNRTNYIKPYIIISKRICSDDQPCTYVYKDAKNNKMQFWDREDKYNIGDTIK